MSASIAACDTKLRLSASLARPKAPHCGRIRSGSQVMSEAALSPIADHTMKPPLITSSGLMPKKAGRQSTKSASLLGSREPTWRSMPKLRAALMVYFAT